MYDLKSYDDLCDIFGSYAIDNMIDKMKSGDDQTQIDVHGTSLFGVKGYPIMQAINDWGK